jgi:hypothetical protein
LKKTSTVSSTTGNARAMSVPISATLDAVI